MHKDSKYLTYVWANVLCTMVSRLMSPHMKIICTVTGIMTRILPEPAVKISRRWCLGSFTLQNTVNGTTTSSTSIKVWTVAGVDERGVIRKLISRYLRTIKDSRLTHALDDNIEWYTCTCSCLTVPPCYFTNRSTWHFAQQNCRS